MTAQRREHVRVPWDVRLRVMRRVDGERAGWLEAEALDVSGGGLRMAGPKILHLGDALRIELTLPDGERIECAARVTRVAPDRDHGLVHGVEIEALPERDRDAIVHHVFDRQRELLRLRAEGRA